MDGSEEGGSSLVVKDDDNAGVRQSCDIIGDINAFWRPSVWDDSTVRDQITSGAIERVIPSTGHAEERERKHV